MHFVLNSIILFSGGLYKNNYSAYNELNGCQLIIGANYIFNS